MLIQFNFIKYLFKLIMDCNKKLNLSAESVHF